MLETMFIPPLSDGLLQTTDLWGWNPATVEAVGSIATVATLVFIIWATFTSKKAADAAKESADIAAREFDLSTRPWLGLTDVQTTLTNPARLMIKYNNFGRTPARNIEFRYRIYRAESPIDEDNFPFGTVFPQEPAEFWVESDRLSQLRDEHKDVEIHGQFKYTSGRNNYTTEILIVLGFSDDSDPIRRWANQSAI